MQNILCFIQMLIICLVVYLGKANQKTDLMYSHTCVLTVIRNHMQSVSVPLNFTFPLGRSRSDANYCVRFRDFKLS